MHSEAIKKYINKLYVGLQLDEFLPAEVYEIYIKKGFETASWRHQRGVHQIVLGDNIFENLNDPSSMQQQKRMLHSLFYHEVSHSLWTKKDLNSIAAELSKKSQSFSLFNLFEDARIENKMRMLTRKLFQWFTLEKMTIKETPVILFYLIVQSENQKKNLQLLKNTVSEKNQALFKEVYEFYVEVIKVQSSTELLPIITRWYEKFPSTSEELESKYTLELLFAQESDTLGSNDDFDTLLEGAENILLVGKPNQKNLHESYNFMRNLKNSDAGTLLSEPLKVAFNTKERDKLLKKMKKLFLIQPTYKAITTPTKKFHTRNLVLNNDKKFRKKELKNTQKKKISIILDLSGSMYDTIADMRLLIDVIDTMTQNNLLDATLILTGVQQLTKSTYQILQMPLEKDVINQINPIYMAEGLNNTMRKNLDLLSQSDYVWIFTDGYIDDEALDKTFFNTHNIITHAMYIGDDSKKETLEQSFNHVIFEKDVEGLSKHIFTLIK